MATTPTDVDDTLTARASHDESPDRRARITAEIKRQTGIDEPMIEQLVRTFYGQVQSDPLIGPVFAERITNWDDHIVRLCAFWSSVVLLTGRYHGQPMPKHAKLPVGATHFDRWLDLFEATAIELCPPAAAAHFIDRARRIADSLEMGVSIQQGQIYKPRHIARANRF